MGVDPPPLPVQGHLLAELGYLEELRAAIALDLSVQTLMEYRKDGRGPAFTVVGRTVLYHPTKLGSGWLTVAPASSRKLPPSRDPGDDQHRRRASFRNRH